MGILTNLILGVVHLVLVALDLGILLAGLRISHQQWPMVHWLAALDAAGQPLAQMARQAIDRPFNGWIGKIGQRGLGPWQCLLVLLVLRTVLAGLARGLSG